MPGSCIPYYLDHQVAGNLITMRDQTVDDACIPEYRPWGFGVSILHLPAGSYAVEYWLTTEEDRVSPTLCISNIFSIGNEPERIHLPIAAIASPSCPTALSSVHGKETQ